MKRTIAFISAATVSLFALSFTTACSRTKAAESAATSPSDLPTAAVARAKREDIAKKLTLSAEFRPFQEIDVMAKVAGYVRQINVDVGDRVRQGQLLAVLEVPEMTDDIDRADAARQRNSAEYERAKDELKRAQSAHDIAHLSYTRLASVFKNKPGLIAQQEVDDAHGRDLVAEAQVSAAKSALAAAQQQVRGSEADVRKSKTLMNYTRVVAPFAGVVTKRYADTGSMIQAGTASQSQARPLVTLSENSLLRLILPVPESAVPSIHIGSVVDVHVPSLNQVFPGKVARFSGSLNLGTRTMETEVDVPNPGLVLVPGMFAEATLTLEQHKNALSIPLNAVADLETQPWVMVVNQDSMVERREIEVGLESANDVEVLSGLKDSETVVVGNRSKFKAGEKVAPKILELASLGSDK